MPLPAVIALDGVIRHYAWGSPTSIPSLLGIEADGQPAAELWLGAHPDDPSRVPGHETTLDRVIAADPIASLGASSVARFGPHLPFLLKVLAADKALSIQVHPNLEQARAGFAAENARGVPRDAARRNYRDANHKPELLCALTPFEALCGFRPVADTLRLLDAFALPELTEVRRLLVGVDGLQASFTHLLRMDEADPVVRAVVSRAGQIPPGSEWAGAARAVTVSGTDFPGDVGAVLSLLLNYVRLNPREAIYLGAGNVHAYLRGTGVEIMANSDNVLRCGLTPKHIDVPELLKITDFSPFAEPVRAARRVGLATWGWDTPVPDFELSEVDLDGSGGALESFDCRPQILLCVSGSAMIHVLGSTVEIAPGRGAFVRARKEGGFVIRGTGTLFVATVGAQD